MAHHAALPTGVFAAALTPLRDDLGVDHETLAEHCRWLLANGCDGVAPLGTTGEANSFSVSERIELLEQLLDAGLPPQRLLVGTGCCAVPDTVTLTRHAVSHGVGGVLVLPPFFYKNASDDGLFAAFEQVIQHVGDARLRIYLYHFPQMSGVSVSHALIDRLIKSYSETVVGMKDSSGDWNNMKSVCQSFPGFRVYAGTEKYLLDILRVGGAGCISATTNVTCALAGRVYAMRNNPASEALQARLTSARDALEAYPIIPALKRLMAERTGRRAWLNLRPPHVGLSEDKVAVLLDSLEQHGFAGDLLATG